MQENTGKLTAEYSPVPKTRSNSDVSYYSTNDCNSTEACSTTSSEGKHNESNPCSGCAGIQEEVECLKKNCNDYVVEITELKESNHKKRR